MSPKERLIKYFKLARRQSQLNIEEYKEFIHLEESLIDDVDKFDMPDEHYRLIWQYIKDSTELVCGPYAIMDTGSVWNELEVLIDAFKKLDAKERLKIADLIGGKVAVSKADFIVEEIKQKYGRKK